MYYDDIFLQNGFIDMLCKISNQFVERLDVLSFDDVRPLLWYNFGSLVLDSAVWQSLIKKRYSTTFVYVPYHDLFSIIQFST